MDEEEFYDTDDYDDYDDYTEMYNTILDEIVNTYISDITNRYLNFNDSLLNNDLDFNRVLQETFETQPSIEKTDHIIDIPSQIYSSIEDKDKYEKECCICLTQFDEDCIVSLLPKCNHILHKECMIEWGKYKTSCPICRNNVEKEKS